MVATSATSPFLRDLRRALVAELVPEMELTMKVAVMSAAGLPRNEIAQRLGVAEIEIKVAVDRLRRVTGRWSDGR